MAIAVVVLYFLVLIAIGVIAHKRVRGSSDEFFVAGRNVSTFTNSWALLASLASGGTVMAGVGTGLGLGLPYAAALGAGAPVGFVVASVLVARPLRSLRRYTVPDYFRWRYGGRLIAWLVPILVVLSSTAYLVAQLKGASIAASYILGVDYKWGLWGAGLVFVLYVSIGGFLSVTWNDVFQGILMVAMVVAISWATYSAMNGYSVAYGKAFENFPDLGAAKGTPISSYIGGFLTWAVAISVLPHVIMRVYSAESVRSARVSLNVAMLLFAGMQWLLTFVLTIGAAVLLAHAGKLDADTVLLALSNVVLGPALQGLVAAAILAAIMSTTAGLLMACNSAIAHDIYATLLRPGASERSRLRVASVSTWVVGLAAIILAMNPPKFLIVLYTAAVGLLAAGTFVPMVLGIWWPRATTRGAVSGMVVGGVSFLIAFVGFDMPPSTEVLVGLPLSAITMVAVSMASGHHAGEYADAIHDERFSNPGSAK
jgi:sodium/pantothenate symporter